MLVCTLGNTSFSFVSIHCQSFSFIPWHFHAPQVVLDRLQPVLSFSSPFQFPSANHFVGLSIQTTFPIHFNLLYLMFWIFSTPIHVFLVVFGVLSRHETCGIHLSRLSYAASSRFCISIINDMVSIPYRIVLNTVAS